jgi:hypothetical protein
LSGDSRKDRRLQRMVWLTRFLYHFFFDTCLNMGARMYGMDCD